MKCWKLCFHKLTLVVWPSLEPGNAGILGSLGDLQHPLSWGHGQNPNHSTAAQGVGLSRNLGKFSLSGLHSFSTRSCGLYLFQPGQLTPMRMREFSYNCRKNYPCNVIYNVLVQIITLKPKKNLTNSIEKKVLLPSNLPSVLYQQRLRRCLKFALCVFDLCLGDTVVRGVIWQTARQTAR